MIGVPSLAANNNWMLDVGVVVAVETADSPLCFLCLSLSCTKEKGKKKSLFLSLSISQF